MTTRIRIKMGEIEVECEGDPDFLRQELPDIFAAIATAYKDSGINPPSSAPSVNISQPAAPGGGTGTTNSIAQKLALTKGKSLMLAASIKLFFVDGKSTFTAEEIHSEAKTANLHYKKSSQGKNWKNYINQLAKDSELNEVTNGNFSLPGDKIESWKSKIA